MSRKAIGIDIGTTTISAVVMAVETKHILEARTISNNSFIHTENSWERIQDAASVTEKAVAVLDELLELHPETASIGLTGQMHGILYVDSEGNAVSPLYTWQDGRGDLPVIQGKSAARHLTEVTGIKAYTGYGCVTHAYHVKQGQVPANARTFCTIADYLGMVLCGRNAPLVHISNGASLGIFDAKNGCFYREKMQEAGVSPDMLPQVTAAFETLGCYRGIPVTAALGDNQASFLGAAGTEPGTVLINMGTGGQISVLADRYFEAPGIEARPFMKDKYLLVGASLCGGRAYAILEQFFRSYLTAAGIQAEAQYPVMERLARTVSSETAELHITTAFSGTRENPEKRGSICGISEDNFTPAQVIYGTLAGMARELYQQYLQISQGTGIQAGKLIASGNGLRKNAVLRGIFAQLFRQELHLAQYQEEAACGAALSSIRNPDKALNCQESDSGIEEDLEE